MDTEVTHPCYGYRLGYRRMIVIHARMVAAWLAACGALGLTASLAVLSRLEMRFGSLYLLAGAGS